MLSIRIKKHQNKRLLNQLNDTLKDFVLGNDINTDAIGNKILQPQIIGLINKFRRSAFVENSASHDQFVERNLADKTKKKVDNAVTTFKT